MQQIFALYHDRPCLGYREMIDDDTPQKYYTWLTYNEVYTIANSFGDCLLSLKPYVNHHYSFICFPIILSCDVECV